jgi:hypothetical protein
MNAYLYSLLALDAARDRTRNAERAWLEAAMAETETPRPNALRRPAARVLASVSRGSAAIARRLDAHVADDLGRTLAPAE